MVGIQIGRRQPLDPPFVQQSSLGTPAKVTLSQSLSGVAPLHFGVDLLKNVDERRVGFDRIGPEWAGLTSVRVDDARGLVFGESEQVPVSIGSDRSGPV